MDRISALSTALTLASGLALAVAFTGCGDDEPIASAPDAAIADAGPGAPDAEARDASPLADPMVHELSRAGTDRLFGAAFDGDGKLIAVGSIASTSIAPDLEMLVARFDRDGRLDRTFANNGIFRRNLVPGGEGEVARSVVVQSTGKIVVYGTVESSTASADPRDRDVVVFRLSATGDLDTTFQNRGPYIIDLGTGIESGTTFIADTAWGMALLPDDSVVLSGSRRIPMGMLAEFIVLKLGPDGAPDRAFGPQGGATLQIGTSGISARNLAVLPDQRVAVAGYRSEAGVVSPIVYMLSPTGRLDTGFGMQGAFNDIVLPAVTEAYSVAPHGTGLVTAGYGRSIAMGTNDWVSLRLTAAGRLDPSWGTMGAAVLDIGGFADNCRDLVVLPDQRVLLVGNGRSTAQNNEAVVGMLTSSGAPDPTFGARGLRIFDLGGPADAFWDAARDDDGRIGVVGLRGGSNGTDDDSAILILPAP